MKTTTLKKATGWEWIFYFVINRQSIVLFLVGQTGHHRTRKGAFLFQGTGKKEKRERENARRKIEHARLFSSLVCGVVVLRPPVTEGVAFFRSSSGGPFVA